jgi:hypothetical protein
VSKKKRIGKDKASRSQPARRRSIASTPRIDGKPTTTSVHLRRAIQAKDLSLEPEAELLLDRLARTGDARFRTRIRKESMKPGSKRQGPRPAVVVTQLQRRTRRSARRLVDAMVGEAPNNVVSAEAFELAQQRSFCTIWPFCAQYE